MTSQTAIAERPRVNSDAPFAPRPLPSAPAHLITSEAEAVEIAQKLAERFLQGAAERDREGYLPVQELDAYSQSGLWALNVPKEYGGLGASYATISTVTAILSGADSSIGQIVQNHIVLVAHLDADGTEAQKRELFDLVLKGYRFGNALSEQKSKTVAAFETKSVDQGDHVLINGEKFYSTGALLAHIVPIVAIDEQGQVVIAFAERDAPGLTVVNDWSSFGQRVTASGSVKLENVRVPKSRVVTVTAFARPTPAGAISQVIQAAVDLGIADQAIRETVDFVKTKSRPWVESGKETAAEDPFTIQAIGDLTLKLHAAEALLERAGRAIDKALAAETEENAAAASLAVAEAKILTTNIAIEATNRLFELSGTRSTLSQHNLDRYWRNARTHTLHDPVRWKYFHIGNHRLNGVNPPRHPWS